MKGHVQEPVAVPVPLRIHQKAGQTEQQCHSPLGPRIRVTSPDVARFNAVVPVATGASPSLGEFSISIESSIEAVGEVIDSSSAKEGTGASGTFPTSAAGG